MLPHTYSRVVWPRKAWEKWVGSVAVQRPREEEHLDRVKTKGDNGAVAAGDNGEAYRRNSCALHRRPGTRGQMWRGQEVAITRRNRTTAAIS